MKGKPSSYAPLEFGTATDSSGRRRGGVSSFQRMRRRRQCVYYGAASLFALWLFHAVLFSDGNAAQDGGRQLTITTWNVAAINNNVFEYWMSIPEEPAYEELMYKVEQFIENPGDKDVRVDAVFTPAMFQQLDQQLQKVGWKSMESYWQDDFSKRQIVANFLKDADLGSKRLVSMPDRVSNLIHTAQDETLYRPSVISMYEKDLPTLDNWWTAWQTYLFDTSVPMLQADGTKADQAIWSMLLPIQRSKYPAITEQEETDSLPLQTMCMAIFDTILMHMLNTVSAPAVWQPLKRKIVQNLGRQKISKTLSILEDQYMDSDIITLQEVSSAMIETAKQHRLGEKYVVVAPSDMDAVRDQNSVILLRKSVFPDWPKEITSQVYEAFPKGQDVPVSRGDIVAIQTRDVQGTPYVIASFHGDTNGLATKPVLDAIVQTIKSDDSLKDHRLIFGLDANTYESPKPGKQQGVTDWAEHFVSYDLTSCWGDHPNPKNYTTYNARTYLQPQLNKACPKDGTCAMADINPKDFILFPKAEYEVVHTTKDNTGKKQYVESTAFPTLNFPSDHGVLSTKIRVLVEEEEG